MHFVNQPLDSSSGPQAQMLRLILHLQPHPSYADASKPRVNSSVEACQVRYTSLIKEADFVRWGNTRRVTGLKRTDLESGWTSVVQSESGHCLRVSSSTRILLTQCLPPHQTTITCISNLHPRHCLCHSNRLLGLIIIGQTLPQPHQHHHPNHSQVETARHPLLLLPLPSSLFTRRELFPSRSTSL